MGEGGYGDSSIGSDLVINVGMADDESSAMKTDSVNEESSSKDDTEWLQLGIGGRQQPSSPNTNASPLLELHLMPTPTLPLHPQFRPPPPAASNFGPSFFSPHHQINWAFRPIPITIAAPSSSSSSSYFPRPFQLYAAVDAAAPPPPPAVDFRVIQPPRRPHSGIWFTLQASQNQEKEPFLPQISKSYLRIKDGRMTIRLVIKYLVNKLSLDNESEIEIRCKGQRLLPFLTLQHVRDSIWSSPRDFITLLPNSSTAHHIMVLHYARTTPSN